MEIKISKYELGELLVIHYPDVARYLEAGADPDIRDRFGDTALGKASMIGDTDIARLLLDHGADMEARDKNGRTPLHIACTYDHTDIARLLLDHGADVNLSGDTWGKGPLHTACSHGNTDIARLLIDHGADVNAKGKNGAWTPLHEASFNSHAEIARLLIDHGADVNARDGAGRTPRDLVHRAGSEQILDLFREAEEMGNPLGDLDNIDPALIASMAAVVVDPRAAAEEEAEWREKYNAPKQQEDATPETEEQDGTEEQDNTWTPRIRPGL